MQQVNINDKQVKINENIKLCIYYYAKVHWLIGLFDKKKDLILSCTQLKFDQHIIHATLDLKIFYKVHNCSFKLL